MLESPPPPQQGANKISSKLHAIYKILLSGDIYWARNLQLSPQLFFPRTVFKRAMCIPSPSECACAVVLYCSWGPQPKPCKWATCLCSVPFTLKKGFFSHAQWAQTRAAAEMDDHLSVLYVGSVSCFVHMQTTHNVFPCIQEGPSPPFFPPYLF